MGYVLRVRFASFCFGAAVASGVGLYFLHNDYQSANHHLSQQMNGVYESLNGRISALEKLKEVDTPKQVEATE